DEKKQRDQAEEANRQEQEQRRQLQRLYIEQLLDKVANLNDKGEAARAALWLAHGLRLVSPDDDDLARILRTNLGEIRSQLPPLKAILSHPKRVRVAALSNDGHVLLTGGDDAIGYLWEVETGKLLTKLPHKDALHAAAFSPDDKLIATGTARS